MTALKEYERLESIGLWRETPDGQRKEVVVAFGDASLVLRDSNDRPLTHWSMAAIERTNSNQRPAIYTVDPDGHETLEIDDKTMIKAIERVRNRIQRARPKPGRLRVWISAITLCAFVIAGVVWLPEATARYATGIVPDAKLEDIGRRALAQVNKLTGTPCSSPYGERALRLLEDRLIGTTSNRILIVDMDQRQSALLPNGNILINKSLLSDQNGPELMAGYVLMERAMQDERPQLYDLFLTAGLNTTLRFLATGTINKAKLDQFAESKIMGNPSNPRPDNLHELFNVAQITSTPFAKSDLRYGDLAAIDNYAKQSIPLLSDEDWLALQEICD
ncbi:hypothetical protein BFP76_12970 [Amylibacter kogurei]|uniref:Uncharacterized protein n=1 Tax=Paramylibacter kogurei TaxID=1889778 RepID=A0A2G5KA57_9RHOB|nr:hypothetical protein [Amylibacter kogurei]PIB25903.1 hypothetical protein BFP76_12970 [Amylibacter kogurei]